MLTGAEHPAWWQEEAAWQEGGRGTSRKHRLSYKTSFLA